MGYINIKELYNIPLNLQISMEQVGKIIDNIVMVSSSKEGVVKLELRTEYGEYVYDFVKTPTYTVEEMVAGIEKGRSVNHITLEQLMWGLYYYITQRFNVSFVERGLNSHNYKKITRLIVEKIIVDNSGPSLISYYHLMHNKEVK